jgi:hypothetical protein
VCKVGACSQGTADLIAVHPRHHHIEQDQVRVAPFDLREPISPVVGLAYVEPRRSERLRRDSAQEQIIIDDQQAD